MRADPMTKKKPTGRSKPGRKPIGVCAKCGALAYKRRSIKAEVGPNEYATWKMPLCPRHYQRHFRYGTLDPGNRSMTNEDVRWARRLYQSGCPAKEVWRRLVDLRDVKVSYGTVWRRLREDYAPSEDHDG